MKFLLLVAAIGLTMCGCGPGIEERNYQAIANEFGPEGCPPNDSNCLIENDPNVVID